MNAKLFVRNLSWSVTEQDLYDLFGQSGEVLSAKIPLRREDGKPRGFAFVEMASLSDGQQAIQQLNGYFLQGRDLVVDFQDENRGAGHGGSGAISSGNNKSNKLFVRSLSYSATEHDLESLFQQVGQVVSVKIPTDRDTGEPKGFGFVEMASVDEAEQAIQSLNHTNLGGKSIVIDYQDANRSKGKSTGFGNRNSGGGGYNRSGYGGQRERSDYSSRW